MHIQDGDIITLSNGDIVKINLKKLTELEVNKKYKLKESLQICHITNVDHDKRTEYIRNAIWTFVGKIDLYSKDSSRYIFWSEGDVYCMYSTNNLRFVVNEINN